MPTLFNLSAEEIQQLKYERYTYGDIIIQKILNAIYLMATTDLNYSQISQAVGCHRNILPSWRDKCLYQGLASLYINHYHKPESILEKHCQSILTHFDKNHVQCVNHAVVMIEELTGIKRSPTLQASNYTHKHNIYHSRDNSRFFGTNKTTIHRFTHSFGDG
jgi:hypothetical protein